MYEMIVTAAAGGTRPATGGWPDWTPPAASGGADRSAQTDRVRHGLAALSPQHREVLLLVHTMGRTVAQAAAVLDLPVATVKVRLWEALRALRDHLAGPC